MNHNKRKAAVTKYNSLYRQGLTTQELEEAMLQDKFTEEEIKEILAVIVAGESLSSPSLIEPAKETSNKVPVSLNSKAAYISGSPYSLFDLWRVEVKVEEKKNPHTNLVFSEVSAFQAIVMIREKVKLEPNVVNDLNAQSHNNGQRYYPTGSVTNGEIEKTSLTTY